LLDSRATPTTTPSTVASTMPTNAISAVFLTPTHSASCTVCDARNDENGIWKPAGWSRNSKPVRSPWRRRLSTRLPYRYDATARTPSANSTCRTARRTRMSRHGGGLPVLAELVAGWAVAVSGG
jgi:hypothetical protein